MTKQQLYKKYAKYYDLIYSKKDYVKEIEFIKAVINNSGLKGKEVLDVACGTGTHAKLLSESGFSVTGVDINHEMLEIARKKASKVKFIEGSMAEFKTSKKFDVITCLFTAINYNKNVDELRSAIQNFYELLKNNGMLIFDLGLTNFHKRTVTGTYLDTYSGKDVQIARISQWMPSRDNPDLVNDEDIILIKENGKVDFEVDEHELGIFKLSNVKTVMKEAGFSVRVYDNFTLKNYSSKSKRPVLIGIKGKHLNNY